MLAPQSFKHFVLFVKKDQTRPAPACSNIYNSSMISPSAVAVEMKFENYKVIYFKSVQVNLKLYQCDIIISKSGENWGVKF